MDNDYIVERYETIRYKVKFRGRSKSYGQTRYINQWIARQIMHPIFEEYHEKYGYIDPDLGPNFSGYSVWSVWREVKPKVIEWLKVDVSHAETMLRKYFDEEFV